MSGRRRLDGVATPHPLGAGLPRIFQPVLTRREATLVRRAARRPPAEDERDAVAAAYAKLGLPDDREHRRLAADRAREDDFLWRLCEGFDGVLVPVIVSLETLDALVDPQLAPDDFLGWLGGWVALRDRTDWPQDGWRRLIAEAIGLYRRRGTPDALRRLVELYTGARVTVVETGGCVDPPGPVPAAGPPSLVVRIAGARRGADDAAFARGVDAVVTIAKPLHVPHRVEWVAG
jgi:phage tail-like protein